MTDSPEPTDDDATGAKPPRKADAAPPAPPAGAGPEETPKAASPSRKDDNNDAGNRPIKVKRGDTVRNATLVERDRRGNFFVRWLKRLAVLAVVLVLLLALLLVGVTLVLKSSVPKSIAESVATGLLKLDVTLGGVDIGWGGGVTVTDLVLRLPSTDGEGEKLVEVPKIAVQLSALPLVPIEYFTSGLPNIQSVAVTSPTIYATQDAGGNWNLLEAATLAASGGAPAPPDEPQGPPNLPPLPDLTVRGGKVVVRNAEGKTATLGEIRVDGEKHNALVYTARGNVGDVAEFTARLLPSSGIRQEATLLVGNLADALSPVFELPQASLDAGWTGGFDGAAVNGTLTINSATLGAIRVARAAPVTPAADQAAATGPAAQATSRPAIAPLLTPEMIAPSVPPRPSDPEADLLAAATRAATTATAPSPATRTTEVTQATQADAPASTQPSPADQDDLGPIPAGRIDVSFADGVLTVKPQEIVARDVPGAPGRVTLVGGTLVAGPEQAVVSDLLVGLLGGQFLVESATVDLQSLTATFATRFRNLQPAGSSDLTGSVAGDLQYGKFGEPRATLAVDAYGLVAGTGLQRLNARVTADGRDFAAATTLDKFRTLDVTLELLDSPVVLGATQESTVLPKLTATVAVRLGANEPQPRIELAELRSLEPELVRLDGGGAFYPSANDQWEEGQYWLWLEERGFPVPLPRVADRMPLDLGIEVGGRWNPSADVQAVEIKNIYGGLADVELAGSGWYVLDRPPEDGGIPRPPLSLLVTLTRQDQMPAPPTPGGRAVALAQRELSGPTRTGEESAADAGQVSNATADAGMGSAPGEGGTTADAAAAVQPVRGMVSTWLYVSGDPMQPLFNASGGLVTDGLSVGPYQIGSLNSQVQATLTADRLLVRTPEPSRENTVLLGAQVMLAADVPFDETVPGKVHFEINNLSLRQAAAAAALPVEASGELNGRLDVWLRGLALPKVRAQGEFVVSQLALPQAYLADSITIRPNLSDGLLTVPIELNQSFAEAPGPTFIGTSHKLALQANYDLSRPNVVEILNLRGDDYPVALAPDVIGPGIYAAARLSAAAPSLTIDLGGDFPTVSGRLQGRADVLSGGAPFRLSTLLTGEIDALATQSRVSLDKLTANLPGLGDVTGGGSLSLQDLPGRSQLYVHGTRLDLAAIAKRLKLPDGAGGFVDFSLTLQPAPGDDPRLRKGEVLANFSFAGDNARWRTVQVGQGQALVYLSRTDRPNGAKSAGQFDFTVITTERMRFQIADGWIDAFAKLRDRGDGVLFLQSSVDVQGVQLRQLGPLLDKPDVRGDVGLSANVFGNLTPEPRFPGEELPVIPVDGQVTLNVRNGKVAEFDLFKAILDRLKFVPQSANDTVDVDFRLERGNLLLNNARAVVSGAELRASGDIKDIAKGGDAPINLSVTAFLRPLGSFKVPFAETIDEFVAALQKVGSALDVTGTLTDPKPVPKSLNAAGSTFKALLGGNSDEPAE